VAGAWVKTSSSGTNAFAFTPTNSGDCLVLIVNTSIGAGNGNCTAVTGSLSGSWTVGKATFNDTAGTFDTLFYKANCPSGADTLTLTFNGGTTPGTFNCWVSEFSGIDTTTPVIGTIPSFNFQATPSAGANAITSGTQTVNLPDGVAGALVVGLTLDLDGNAMSAGTGYTQRYDASVSGAVLQVETQRVTSSASQTATATSTFGASHHFVSIMLALAEPVTGPVALVGQTTYASPVTANQFATGCPAVSSNTLTHWSGGNGTATAGTATTAWLNVGAPGTANTAKVCLYDNGGHLIAVSAAINVTTPGLKSGAISATISTSTGVGYALIVVCDTGSFSTVSNTGSDASVDAQWLAANFSYASPPTLLPGPDHVTTGQEFIVYLTAGGTAYNLSCSTTTYSTSIQSASLVNVGATHTYVMPASAVMFDRLLGVSTDDQILNVSSLRFSRSISDAQFLPHGGLLSLARVSFNRLVGSAQFIYTQAATTSAAVSCSYNYANYAAFRTAIQQLMDGDDVSTSSLSVQVLDAIIATGERRLYRDVHSSAQDTALSVTVTNNSAPMPSDLIELRSVYLATAVPIIYMPYEQLQEKLQIHGTSSRKANYYTFEGDNIIFYPPQADGTVITGRYYKRFCSIVTEGLAGNTYFARFPDLWIYAALLESAPFIGEATRMPVWQERYQEIVMSIMKFERRRYTQGSKLSIRVS
jgi:hypothetical protein